MPSTGAHGVKRTVTSLVIDASEGTRGCIGHAMLSYEKRSEILRALAHPARMEIVMRLEKDGCNVSRIQKNLGLPQSTISQHLRVLRNAGIVSCHREGTQVCYRVEMPGIIEIVEMLGRV
jgi:ArsR family transcriptional regulator